MICPAVFNIEQLPILFKDQRDNRPLVYNGRLLSAAGDTSASSWLWKGSYLVKNRRTIKDPPQLSQKDMAPSTYLLKA
jgi:hypothetical protein